MTTIIHDEANEAPIDELFAFLSIDATGEGVCATILPHLGSTPLITSKMRVAEGMKQVASKLALMGHKHIRLVRFSRVDVLWEIDGRWGKK